mmetsp:Transcript_5497/g.8546  ORF Transcript_5497/g.8546 Transcript_5497/m.8546 type:complete len:253 (-) Transcript_5497:67-825(-)
MTATSFASDKLAAINDDFSIFNRHMDRTVKQRVDKEQDELHSLKLQIAKLEATLNQEVKRRNETNKALQGMFQAQMATVQDKLEAGLVDRLEKLLSSVDTLNERVNIVETSFNVERERYVIDMEDKSAMVARDIAGLKSAFQQEWSERKERETLIIAKLRDLDERSAESMLKEQKVLEVQVEELHSDLNVVGHEEDKRFHEHVFQELAALKSGLVMEAQTREQSDDEIVAALKHYTESVQEAMRIVNQAVTH